MSVSQLDVVGAGGASGALIDAEKEAAKQVLMLSVSFCCCCYLSVPCVCLCEQCLLTYGCRTIRYTRRTCRSMYV
jgi:hypothetical protein